MGEKTHHTLLKNKSPFIQEELLLQWVKRKQEVDFLFKV